MIKYSSWLWLCPPEITHPHGFVLRRFPTPSRPKRAPDDWGEWELYYGVQVAELDETGSGGDAGVVTFDCV